MEHLDVVIVGAGLSGIDAAYRLQTTVAHKSFAILEARDAIGGTWDLFRYPGVRSDSDMFTLGYPFAPWRDAKSIADGPAIVNYIRETAKQHGIDKRIRYGTKVVAASWSSANACWTLQLQTAAGASTLTCNFLYCCTGYYDYEHPHAPQFPGKEQFTGTFVHPQFWPEDLDYTGKQVVVIGSGATAVTLVPSMAKDAAHVTMLQRSPTWIAPVPRRDKHADRIRALLPPGLAHSVIRVKNIAFAVGFYQFCRRFPQLARRLLTGMATKIIGDAQLVAEHFTPTYAPWDQRLCAAPNADFFVAVKKGTAEVVTDHIDTFVPEGIRLASGRVLPADIIVSATGLKLLAFGGIALTVDDKPVPLSDQFVWQGTMLTGVPNFAVCIGYTNASWTLRADLTSRLVCRVLAHLDRTGARAVVPRPRGRLIEMPLLDLSSGYVQRSIGDFPRQGHRRPWKVRQNYILDATMTLRSRIQRTLVRVHTEDGGTGVRVPADAVQPLPVDADA